MVHTDGWRGYAGLAAAGYQHQVTVLSGGSDPAHEVMPRVHLVASLLKRWLIGTHQGGVSINISTTTSTNSPSASIAADQRPAGCSFIASPNKPSPLDPRPTTPSSSHRVPATPGQRGNEGDTQSLQNVDSAATQRLQTSSDLLLCTSCTSSRPGRRRILNWKGESYEHSIVCNDAIGSSGKLYRNQCDIGGGRSRDPCNFSDGLYLAEDRSFGFCQRQLQFYERPSLLARRHNLHSEPGTRRQRQP